MEARRSVDLDRDRRNVNASSLIISGVILCFPKKFSRPCDSKRNSARSECILKPTFSDSFVKSGVRTVPEGVLCDKSFGCLLNGATVANPPQRPVTVLCFGSVLSHIRLDYFKKVRCA